MQERKRLAEAEKQLGIVLEKNGDGPHTEELEAMRARLTAIRQELAD